jgi:hypothetical protein
VIDIAVDAQVEGSILKKIFVLARSDDAASGG